MTNYWLNKDKEDLYLFEIPEKNVELYVEMKKAPEFKEHIMAPSEWLPVHLKLGDNFTDADDISKQIFDWLLNFYDFIDDSKKSTKGHDAFLTRDGVKRKLTKAWPSAINFSELDFTNSESVIMEVTLRYNKCEVIND